MNNQTASLSELSHWFKMDRRKLSRALSEAGIVPAKEGAAHLYPLPEAAKIAFEAKIQTEQTSADRRNIALANKLELETASMRAEHLPIGKAASIVRQYGSLLNRLVAESELSDDAKSRFAERWEYTDRHLESELRGEIVSESEED